MKVLLVNGSRREFGCTYTALKEVAGALENAGIGTEILYGGKAAANGSIDEIVKKTGAMLDQVDGIVLGSGIINKVQMDIYNNVKWEHEVEDDKVCVLHTLAISPRSGKMGLGKQFLRFYEDYALHNGCSELRIDTNELNIIARKMYSKLGYKELSILPTIYNGLPHVNLVLMEKYIGGHA